MKIFMEFFSHTSLPSAFGTFCIVWKETEKGPRVYRIFLPNEQTKVESLVLMNFAGSGRRSCSVIAELGEQIQSFLAGEAVDFKLDIIAFNRCSEFQKRVFLSQNRIPRGRISTYGRIAKSLGIPGSARAVGRALAHNPFPVIIPCHRTVRSNGEPGGFQSKQMKRALLELEGIEFSQSGKRIFCIPKYFDFQTTLTEIRDTSTLFIFMTLLKVFFQ